MSFAQSLSSIEKMILNTDCSESPILHYMFLYTTYLNRISWTQNYWSHLQQLIWKAIVAGKKIFLSLVFAANVWVTNHQYSCRHPCVVVCWIKKKTKDFSCNVIRVLTVKGYNHIMGPNSEDSDFKFIECQNYKNPYRSSFTSAGLQMSTQK